MQRKYGQCELLNLGQINELLMRCKDTSFTITFKNEKRSASISHVRLTGFDTANQMVYRFIDYLGRGYSDIMAIACLRKLALSKKELAQPETATTTIHQRIHQEETAENHNQG
jgi:hypothetical protein